VRFSVLMCLPAFDQGNPTGTISGRISDAQGGALPGVTITASSALGAHVPVLSWRPSTGGRRTVNVAPRPRPSLCAVTDPP